MKFIDSAFCVNRLLVFLFSGQGDGGGGGLGLSRRQKNFNFQGGLHEEGGYFSKGRFITRCSAYYVYDMGICSCYNTT